MTGSREETRLAWQSKLVLLLVVPWTATSVAIESLWWARNAPVVVWQSLGISAVFGLLVWRLRAATLGGALTGAAITASLMLSTARYPYEWAWLHGGLMPLLAVFVLTYVATKIGRAKKEQMGTAESKRGRNAAQVAANLGMAALAPIPAQLTAISYWSGWIKATSFPIGQVIFLFLIGTISSVASLAEATADTVSSELGQVFGGTPWLITSLRKTAPGTDGGITLVGTLAGIAGAFATVMIALVAQSDGKIPLHSKQIWYFFAMASSGGIVGLLMDSILGATLERKGWLNNDAVNFLSTLFTVVLVIGELTIFGFPIKD